MTSDRGGARDTFPALDAAPGRLILVVGPSGAGKDTLIEAARRRLAGDPRRLFPRRVVTRPSSAAEDNIVADEAGFRAVAAHGGFALTWQAHGHFYGIPAAIVSDLAEGRTVVINVSRTVIAEARQRFGEVTVVEVTAPVEVLAARIATRGRASDGESGDRIGRRVDTGDGAVPDVTIDNGGNLEAAVAAFLVVIAGR